MTGSLTGGRRFYPPLDGNSVAAQRMRAIEPQLHQLLKDTGENLEVLPGEQVAYVFIGKPPKKFGLAWILNGRIKNFKTLVEEDHVSPPRLERATDELREIYKASQNIERYSALIGDRSVVVTPDQQLQSSVHDVIQRMGKK